MARSPSKKSSSNRQSLSAQDWAQAALDVMVARGLDGVAVEPLARELGVTKGSFYWHFANRDALLDAALQLWERQETDDVLAQIADVTEPYERIVALFKRANASYRAGRLYLALAAAGNHPQVRAVVERVSQRRMDYLLQCYLALGMNEHEAGHWSRFAYATFAGNLQIRRDTPEAMPSGAAFSEDLKLMIKTLIPRGQREEKSASSPPQLVALSKTGSD